MLPGNQRNLPEKMRNMEGNAIYMLMPGPPDNISGVAGRSYTYIGNTNIGEGKVNCRSVNWCVNYIQEALYSLAAAKKREVENGYLIACENDFHSGYDI